MKKNDCTRRGLLGLLLALCMTLLLLTPALAGVTDVTGGSGGTSGTGLSGATGGYNSPKTFDAGLAVYAASAMLSGAGLTVLRCRKR